MALLPALILAQGSMPAQPSPPRATVSDALAKVTALAQQHLDRFWTEQVGAYQRPARMEAYVPGTSGPCFANRPKGNAYFCQDAGERAIYFDPAFLDGLLRQHGQYAPVLVLAHEWGHHVQSLSETPFRFSLQDELQADCLAGAFTRDAADSDLFGPAVTQESARTILTLGDTLPWFHAGAHGRRGQRIDAFDYGFDRQTCLADTFFAALGIDEDTLEQLPVSPGQSLKEFALPLIGEFSRQHSRHLPTSLETGALQGIVARYQSRTGVEVLYVLSAFATEERAVSTLDALVAKMKDGGFEETRRATVADADQRRLGTLVGLEGGVETIVWTNQRVLGMVEGPPDVAWAFARLVTTPDEDD